jgi:hypothetical protein
MTDVPYVVSQIKSGNSNAARQLLPLVYDERRKLAAQKLINEKPRITLTAARQNQTNKVHSDRATS